MGGRRVGAVRLVPGERQSERLLDPGQAMRFQAIAPIDAQLHRVSAARRHHHIDRLPRPLYREGYAVHAPAQRSLLDMAAPGIATDKVDGFTLATAVER